MPRKERRGFTLAQLSELYISAALQLHYDNDVNLRQLIAEMKSGVKVKKFLQVLYLEKMNKKNV